MDCRDIHGADNFDSIKSMCRSVKPSPAALIRAALKWVRVLSSLTKKKRHPLGTSSFGADDRTRTCTLARWNLNPMSLPIPPHPHIHFLQFREWESNESSCCGARRMSSALKSLRPSPTAATRSARFIRHRRRSHRFPIPPHPHVGLF